MRPTLNDQLLDALKDYGNEEPVVHKEDLTDNTAYLPKLKPLSYAMSCDVLCSALFGVARAGKPFPGDDGEMHYPRKYVEQTYETTNGASLQYRGKELRQDDLTVLLHLVHLRRGMATSCAIEKSPYALLLEMGWSDSAANLVRLKDSLLRLRGGLLIVERNGKKGDTINFLSGFAWDGLSKWSITISDKIVPLFAGTTTYLSMAKRKELAEGLQTWLYGYVRANRFGWAVPLETIHKACGSSAANMKEFARSVREALAKLADLGVVGDNSTVKNGRVSIFKL